jgi:hypothetical protein
MPAQTKLARGVPKDACHVSGVLAFQPVRLRAARTVSSVVRFSEGLQAIGERTDTWIAPSDRTLSLASGR